MKYEIWDYTTPSSFGTFVTDITSMQSRGRLLQHEDSHAIINISRVLEVTNISRVLEVTSWY